MALAIPEVLKAKVEALPALDPIARVAARRRFDSLPMELGAFAGIETALELCAAITADPDLTCFERVQVLSLLADSGIARRWPRAGKATLDQAQAMLAGEHPAAAFLSSCAASFLVVDAGIAARLEAPSAAKSDPSAPRFSSIKPRRGTGDIASTMAMSEDEAEDLLDAGFALIDSLQTPSVVIVSGGGRASEVSSTALLHAPDDGSWDDFPQRPAGFDDIALGDARRLLSDALQLHRNSIGEPIGLLASLGGFEHAALAGVILAAASKRCPVLIDGLAATAAAAWLWSFAPQVASFVIPVDANLPAPWLREGLATPLLASGVRSLDGAAGLLACANLQSVRAVYASVQADEPGPGGFKVNVGELERSDGRLGE